MANLIEISSREGEKKSLEELDDTTLKVTGKAYIQRRLFEQNEREVFSITFKGGPSLEVGQNVGGFIIESIEAFEDFFIIKGKKV